MERSNPEFPNNKPIEFSEDLKEKLTILNDLLNSLFQSLNKGGEINSIYSVIAKEQAHAHPNKSLLKDKRLELITACIKFRTPLLFAASALPPEIKDHFKRKKVDLMNLSEQLITDVGNLYDQNLTKNPEENIFRISVWMDKISTTLNEINTLLKQENA